MSQKPTEYELRDAELLVDRIQNEREKLEDGKINLEWFCEFVAKAGAELGDRVQRRRGATS
jgi:hypothetical protein